MLLQFFMAEIPAVLLGGTAILPPEAAVKYLESEKPQDIQMAASPTAGRDKKEKPLRRVTHCPSVPYNIP